MTVFVPPPVETRVKRRCPQCGGIAAVHGRIVRAIHDWETTFVECLRLRCCGTTFLAAPRGLTPRARYSDRVVGLVRALTALGLPLRECARVLRAARVPATVQAIRRWCEDVTTAAPAGGVRAAVVAVAPGVATAPPAGSSGVALPLGARVWLTLETAEPAAVVSHLEREMPRRAPVQRAADEPRCRMVVIPRGASALPYSDAVTP